MNILTEKNEPLKGKALYDAAQSGCIFVENGLAGVKDADGNVIIPPSYGQICWEGDTLAMKHYYKSGYSFRYLHPSGGETSSICRENEFGIFTQDGKVGLDDGRIRIPAEYDEVFPWGNNSDVYYLRKGSEGSPIIGKARLGELLRVADYGSSWACVVKEDGTRGYIMTEYLIEKWKRGEFDSLYYSIFWEMPKRPEIKSKTIQFED